jgi:hypothetical protein
VRATWAATGLAAAGAIACRPSGSSWDPGAEGIVGADAGAAGDAASDRASTAEGAAIDGEAAGSGDGAGEPATADAAGTACAALPLCDDFESDAPGAAPSGWTIAMGCDPNTVNGPVDGGGLRVSVDGAEHHAGSRSLRVVGGDSCGFYAVNATALARVGLQVYVRFWARFSAGPTHNHNGFLSMATAGGDHLRLGFQDDVVAWNAQQSDATLPDMDPQGTSMSISPAAQTWGCIEFHVDESTGHVELWENGSSDPVAGLSWNGSSVQGISDQWARGAPSPLVLSTLAIGWLGLNDQETVWFDDVALGGARIGCD